MTARFVQGVQASSVSPSSVPAIGSTELSFRMAGPDVDLRSTLCVDGRVFGLPCLSHWPGPPPPLPLAHDVTTGMALAYVRATVTERQDLLGSFSVLTNDHYDTDGALALFTLLHPELALSHADLMIRAARTGDFRTWHGEDALAVDLTVWGVRESERSPLREHLQAIDDYAQEAELCYRWLFAELPSILAEPFKWRALWHGRFDRIVDEYQRLLAGYFRVDDHKNLDLAVVYLREPVTRHLVVAAAGQRSRVLVVHERPGGYGYRFAYRNESWFLQVRDRTPPRFPLDDAVRELVELEPSRRGSWWCTPINSTSAQIGFGDATQQADVFGDFRPDLDPASQLAPAVVLDVLRKTLSRPHVPSFAVVRPQYSTEPTRRIQP